MRNGTRVRVDEPAAAHGSRLKRAVTAGSTECRRAAARVVGPTAARSPVAPLARSRRIPAGRRRHRRAVANIRARAKRTNAIPDQIVNNARGHWKCARASTGSSAVVPPAAWSFYPFFFKFFFFNFNTIPLLPAPSTSLA